MSHHIRISQCHDYIKHISHSYYDISHLYHVTSVSYHFTFISHHIMSTPRASHPYHHISHRYHVISLGYNIPFTSHHTTSISNHITCRSRLIYIISTLGHNRLGSGLLKCVNLGGRGWGWGSFFLLTGQGLPN